MTQTSYLYPENHQYMGKGNKLFCTFSTPENIDSTIENLINKYTILYNKIFILSSPDIPEYIITYNIDTFNCRYDNNSHNTILVHRRKEVNCLYTINSLNIIICELNNGVLDTSYKINWDNYRNTVLLTQGGNLRKIGTKIHSIIQT